MSSSLTSQPVLSSLNLFPSYHPRSSHQPKPAPELTAFVYAESYSYRSLMLLKLLGGEHRRFNASALAAMNLEELARCDFILLDASNMTSIEVQEVIAWIRSATLAPLVVLMARELTHEAAALQAGADAVIAFSESLEVSVALCKATIRRSNRQR
ncbi:hypothetical protein [Caldilinea sp.]|jgi:CheY-like chemotaxis protein|uniref:hypothetical protein n=1 Tax=Caldilinea sp. TaxID=2293560 RepID=UPI0021DB9F20|nr:hypothetical protein [Caldilinea sp.]GIV73150.1 MAG: hypothetical protein KatS3mg049_1706 [Caldilinea sp.]